MRPHGPDLVLDTNVWISGLLTATGAPARLARFAVLRGSPVFSAATFAELQERLWRPKFDRYVSIEMRKALLTDLESVARWVDVPPDIAARPWCRDPNDDPFIHAALAAGAPWLISGDRDLLVLAADLAPAGLHILSPADALALPAFAAP
jgi:putative PIN family toxin of toxin-antitoxin system